MRHAKRIIALLLGGGILMPATLAAQGAPNPANPTPFDTVYCPVPLVGTGEWEYEVRRGGTNVGTMTMKLTGSEDFRAAPDEITAEGREIAGYFNWKIANIAVQDSFTGKTYRRQILHDYSSMYVLASRTRIYPFLPNQLRPGISFHGQLVVSVVETTWQNTPHAEAKLMSLDGRREERYLASVGLSYVRDGDVEYVLVRATPPACE